MQPLQADFFGIPQSDETIQARILQDCMQIRMEQNVGRTLEGKKDARIGEKENERKSCRRFGAKEPKMEGWSEDRQDGIYNGPKARSSVRRLSRLCKGAQISYGGTFGQDTGPTGGHPSC